MPLPLLAAAHRAARRMRKFRGGGAPDAAQRAMAILDQQRGVLAAQVPRLGLVDPILLATSEDRLTYRVGWGEHRAVLKLALAPAADRRLRREARALVALERAGQLGTPRLLAQGRAATGRYQVESELPGRPAATADERLLVPAARLIAPIHAGTVSEIVVDARWLRRRVDEPLDRIGTLLRGAVGERAELSRLISLGSTLRASLNGRRVRVALTHGDFWSQNLLLDDRGTPSGVVDWDSAGCASPAVDALHLVLYGRKQRSRAALGVEFERAVGAPDWSAAERACLELLAPELFTPDGTVLVWLFWLHLVRSNIDRHPALATDLDWVVENVARPLRQA